MSINRHCNLVLIATKDFVQDADQHTGAPDQIAPQRILIDTDRDRSIFAGDVIMTAKNRLRAHLPDGIEIGQRFLLRFDDPRVEMGSYQGRLQDLSKSGLLCFDAPDDVRPPRGTPVTVRSLYRGSGGSSCSFSSEIRGRGRLRRASFGCRTCTLSRVASHSPAQIYSAQLRSALLCSDLLRQICSALL